MSVRAVDDQSAGATTGSLTQVVCKRRRMESVSTCTWWRTRTEQTFRSGRQPLLRGRTVVVLQQATKPLSTDNCAFEVRQLLKRLDQLIAQALVIALVMIMVRELAHRSSERCLPDQDE